MMRAQHQNLDIYLLESKEKNGHRLYHHEVLLSQRIFLQEIHNALSLKYSQLIDHDIIPPP